MLKVILASVLAAQTLVQPAAAATTINVSNAAELIAALKAAKPGDTIQLADGDYGDQFVATTSGTMPPANTARRRNSACSPASSRS